MQYFSLYTNVNQLRIGRGVSIGIGKELGTYVVTTMEIPWNIIGIKALNRLTRNN